MASSDPGGQRFRSLPRPGPGDTEPQPDGFTRGCVYTQYLRGKAGGRRVPEVREGQRQEL